MKPQEDGAAVIPDVSAYVDEYVASDLYRYVTALEKIRDADLRRCSAGWLQQIAEEALKP